MALSIRSGSITIPDQCELDVSSGIVIPFPSKNNEFKIYFLDKQKYPIHLTVTDLYGAHKTFQFDDPSELKSLKIEDNIVKTPFADPPYIDTIPQLCPRTKLENSLLGKKLIYNAKKDLFNDKPRMQLIDPDIQSLAVQKKILENFDDQNTLIVERVKITHDYETTKILDYDGPQPLTKKPGHKVYEGEGGFYANFHFAIVPYEERYLKLDRQELLNLVQGKLLLIGREDLLPKMRVHSFLPGPYLSKNSVYNLCEWGDTEHQSKEQELYYENLKVWDWDLTIENEPVEKLLFIVWEGDEEAWMITEGLLDPFYLTDDLVGIFVIEKNQTSNTLTLKNKSGDFEMDVVTREGD